MEDRASKRALEAYPPKMRYVGIDSVKDDRKIDVNKPMRDRFVKAYHQAEKDLELTLEDMRELHIIFTEVDVDIELCKTDIKAETLGYYQEVLKRFKSYGKKEI